MQIPHGVLGLVLGRRALSHFLSEILDLCIPAKLPQPSVVREVTRAKAKLQQHRRRNWGLSLVQPGCHRRSGRPSSAAGTQGRRSWTQENKLQTTKNQSSKQTNTLHVQQDGVFCVLKGYNEYDLSSENLKSSPRDGCKRELKSYVYKK